MVVRLQRNVFKVVQSVRETCHEEVSAVAKISDSLWHVQEFAELCWKQQQEEQESRKMRRHATSDSVGLVDQTVGAIA